MYALEDFFSRTDCASFFNHSDHILEAVFVASPAQPKAERALPLLPLPETYVLHDVIPSGQFYLADIHIPLLSSLEFLN
jgi:hypothetical protein